jgi:hypothetical protein
VRWLFIAVSAAFLALTIWAVIVALTQQDPARRARAAKAALVGVAFTGLYSVGFIYPTADILLKVVDVQLLIAGIFILVFRAPDRIFPGVERYRDTPQYPRFLRALSTAKGGLAFFLVSMGGLGLLSGTVPYSVLFAAQVATMAGV